MNGGYWAGRHRVPSVLRVSIFIDLWLVAKVFNVGVFRLLEAPDWVKKGMDSPEEATALAPGVFAIKPGTLRPGCPRVNGRPPPRREVRGKTGDEEEPRGAGRRGNRGGNKPASGPSFTVRLGAPWVVSERDLSLNPVKNREVVAKSADGVGEANRFNSGKWLQIPSDFRNMGTKREQVIVLPPFSVHGREAGNCVIRFRLEGKQHSIATATRDRRRAAQDARPLLIRWMITHGQAVPQKTPLRAEIEAAWSGASG